ncbi:MAG: tyrosine-protein phosphatase, partial [Bacilli bacterium]|nr:tyrosine-protein phosphatase [Bacilli bacterium]
FKFGDSCDITFSNNLKFEDIPFYSGYYVRTGEPLIVGYPGYQYIAVTRNNEGLWTSSNLSLDDKVTVTLREEGKYIDTQEALSQSYSNNRSEYTSDIQFANFRALSGGNLKDNFLFRGASPVDNQKNRASIVNNMLEEKEIKFILDLADSEEEYLSYQDNEDFDSYYSASLYEKGNVALLSMGSSYGSDVYKQKLASGLKKMINANGPMYIHCLEGKDRTGFVCLLLEGLAGATYEEMLIDYMKTYENYYGISKESSLNKYNAIANLYFHDFMSYLHRTDDVETLKNASYVDDVTRYLSEAGMTSSEIISFANLISK